jgi:ferric-dicitrate binding protein FerR (iron transport regulator)
MVANFLRISHLVKRYLADEINPEELAELTEWQKEYPIINQWLTHKDEKKTAIEEKYQEYLLKDIMSDWDQIKTRKKQKRRRKVKQAWMMAASVLIIISLGTWLLQQPGEKAPGIAQIRQIPVEPGVPQALLTLSDGSTIRLGQQKDLVIEEGDLKMKMEDEELDYSGLSSKQVYVHKIEVPRGGTYFMQLADGTKVWLNAESEMEFPTAFNGPERIVSLTGEAYFEVAKDPLKPFSVKVNGTIVEAVGTAFNINTHWKDGQVKTILTEGKIKVSDGNNTRFVKEGFASVSGGGVINIEKADIEEAMAWKDGYFYFNGKNLKEIVEEISRWYNVEMKFDSKISNETYKGGIKRTESIEAVCAMIEELSGFDLEIKNRTLIVNRKK